MKGTFWAALALLLAGCSTTSFDVALIEPEQFEMVVDGKPTSLYTLSEGLLTMQVTNFGARVVALWAPDRNGDLADIAIGYESLDRYINNTGERFLGAAVGPVANRIADGRMTLDGVEYRLSRNNNGQTLHGGLLGVDRIVWDVKSHSSNKIVFECTLPDGQDGFPGNRHIEMTYSLTPRNEFVVTYEAQTDTTTVMNLSHHSFFNLSGEGSGTILDHTLTIAASHITPVDSRLIPTGEIMPVDGTPFDFRTPHTIGERIDNTHEQLRMGAGYDHNWIIDRKDDGEVVKFADLYEPKSGRGIEVWSDQIAMQFYSGNFFDGSYCGKYERPIEYRGAVVFETQRYPDAPNHPNFPSVELRAGETYRQTCIYKFYVR